MNDPVITVENVSKRYTLGTSRHDTLRDRIAHAFRTPWKRKNAKETDPTEFWALRDVSFQVKRGEVLGIIGRNGAGKSTLLKTLARITEPTTGRIRIRGRIASLLEVGTGFHPELTGRENIFLNGAILGMSRAEIRRKFDEMVAFAEVEQFIDTPVKRYSSGMYVRLAFAVAAHLEPEILIIDEVLAVGDAAFQKKCIGKMETVASQGRTVLFVSHNLAVVNELCHRAVLLAQGRLIMEGEPFKVVRQYVGHDEIAAAKTCFTARDHDEAWGGSDRIQLLSARLVENTFPTFTLHWRELMRLEFEFDVKRPTDNFFFAIAVATVQGANVFGSHHNDNGAPLLALAPGRYRLLVTVENPLRAGTYHLSIGASSAIGKAPIFRIGNALQFEVLDVSQDKRPYPQYDGGPVNGEARWENPVQIPATLHAS